MAWLSAKLKGQILKIPNDLLARRYGAFNKTMLQLDKKLERIDSELKNGFKSKAIDRLRNLIQQNPNEIKLRNKLAEIYYESGFLDEAGKYWILTEPTEKRIKNCVDIYEKSVNHSSLEILKNIVFRGQKNLLSQYGQNKLGQLEHDCKEKHNYIPKYGTKPKFKAEKNKQLSKDVSYLMPILILLLLAFFLVGAITTFKWLFL